MRKTVYLNRVHTEKDDLIKLLFRKDENILKLIRNNDWISYNPNYNGFCTTFTDFNIALIHDLFEGIAEVNTTYLNSILPVK